MTIFLKPYDFIDFSITSINSEEETIPIFTASGKMSVATALICSSKNSGLTSNILKTPVVFCAVKEVIALMPKTLQHVNVFKSAWMPAPPLESLPAIVRTVFICLFILKIPFYLERRKIPPCCRYKNIL